jgi:hypothetical protein
MNFACGLCNGHAPAAVELLRNVEGDSRGEDSSMVVYFVPFTDNFDKEGRAVV